MAMTDPVADLLTRIRNATQEGHEKVDVPASRLKANIAKVLEEEGYIKGFKLLRSQAGLPIIKIVLKYDSDGSPVIRGIRRVSTPGLRRYAGYSDFPRPLSGAGICIVSTSKGILTGRRANTQKVGGEILCEVW